MRTVPHHHYRWQLATILAGGTIALCAAAPAFAAGGDDGTPPFDWSVGLRGQYTLDNTGPQYEAIVAPDMSLRLDGARGETTLSTGGEFAYDGSSVHADDLHLGAATSYQFDPSTSADGSLDLSLVQLRPGDTGLPVNTAIGPLEFTGTAAASATQKLGLFELIPRVTAQRFIEGPTTLDDTSTVDNTASNYWQAGAGLRGGFEMSPLLSVFVDGEISAQKFDAANPTVLKFLDGQSYQLRGGVSYNQGSVLSAEASFGRAWLDYSDPGLADASAWVTDASLSFKPDETLSIEGALDTTLVPSTGTAGDTDLDTALTGSAKYAVNPWVTLRGSAAWNRTLTLGNGDVGTGYSLGAGFDINSSRHAAWTADYLFTHNDAPPAAPTDTQAVTVGLTIKR